MLVGGEHYLQLRKVSPSLQTRGKSHGGGKELTFVAIKHRAGYLDRTR
jgi:hypothetical protein